MKKLGTLLVLFAVGLFSVAPMVGCGGEEEGAGGGDTTTETDGDAGSGDKEDE